MSVRKRIVISLLGVLMVVGGALPARAATSLLDTASLLAEVATFAAAHRGEGPVYVDPTPDVDRLVGATHYVLTRAHDYGGWFNIFAAVEGGGVVVGFWQLDDAGFATGSMALLDPGTLETSSAKDFSLSTTARGPGDDLMQEEEERCQFGLDLTATLLDCRLDACSPTPGPFGVFFSLVGPISCKASAGKGLTWWSGLSYDRQIQDNWGPTTRGYTEIVDFDYVSQSCAPPESVRAWDDATAGSLNHGECYDFRGAASGPTKRVNVIYTLDAYWADGLRSTHRYVSPSTAINGLIYHTNNLPRGTYLMHIDMTESLPPSAYISQYRFGRAFREYTFRWCHPTSGNCS